MLNRLLHITLLLFLVQDGMAQDQIITTSQDTINCKIVELNETNIGYQLTSHEKSSNMLRSEVADMTFGKRSKFRLINYDDKLQLENPFEKDKRNVFKLNITSIKFSSLKLYYERSLHSLVSIEAGATYYGLGEPVLQNSEGFSLEASFKFNLSRLIRNDYHYPDHILTGVYLGFNSSFTELNQSRLSSAFDPQYNDNRSYRTLGLDLGFQAVRVKNLVFDFYVGGVIIYGSSERQYSDQSSPVEHLRFRDGDLKVVNRRGLRSGIKIGYLFGGN